MKWLAGIAAAFRAASWMKSVAGWASWIPGAGPIAGAIGAAASFVVVVIKAFFEGLSICFANPVVFLVVAAAFAGGLWQGIRWDAHKVEVARSEVAALKKRNADAQAEAEARLEKAHAARNAAEEAAKSVEDRDGRNRAELRRLRALAKPATPAAGGSWMSGFPALFKADDAPKPR